MNRLSGPHTPKPATRSGTSAADPFAAPRPSASVALKTPPAWLYRPCGATWGFGNKLVTFAGRKREANQPQYGRAAAFTLAHAPRPAHTGARHTCGVISTVTVAHVATDAELVKRALQLDTTVDNGNYIAYCEGRRAARGELAAREYRAHCVCVSGGDGSDPPAKAQAASSDDERIEWAFLRILQETDSRIKFSSLLGFNAAELDERLAKLGLADAPPPPPADVPVDVPVAETSSAPMNAVRPRRVPERCFPCHAKLYGIAGRGERACRSKSLRLRSPRPRLQTRLPPLRRLRPHPRRHWARSGSLSLIPTTAPPVRRAAPPSPAL